ncbi:hypothetical protein [Nocardioides sp. T2.26MG-1]|uniref:hypothetical protein n=1 Tax=Nocardioides sp. T2.26MG-1 TaxID=3041166 RepID=UPI0024774EEE|nr:hypothetical protein [Nocardioides sp. T2.26MG-1]CAI9411975.1 hypothetical protein HIDPHFAB_01652 [Nocardioides sp. T2.26MG-1]
MARKRKAYLHIGLPRTGGAFLDSAFAEHAEALDALGVRQPAVSPDEMFRAAAEIRRDHKAWGYQRREVEGAWAGICRRAHRGRHDVVFSQELLAPCTPGQIDLLLDGLAGFEVHLVVTARDLGSQLLSAWTGAVEAGRSASFARYRKRVMDPAREHEQAQRFWAGQDLGDVLERWSGAVRKPHRIHVVVVPDQDPHQAVWGAVGEIVGFDAAALPLSDTMRTEPAAPGAAGLAVLRSVNRAVDGRLSRRTHRTVVGRHLAEGTTEDGARPALPPDLYDDLLEVGERWRKQLADGGYDVHGDTMGLLPAAPQAGMVPPDDVPAEERLATATGALADALVEVARLREHNQALELRNAKLARKRKKLKRRLAAEAR